MQKHHDLTEFRCLASLQCPDCCANANFRVMSGKVPQPPNLPATTYFRFQLRCELDYSIHPHSRTLIIFHGIVGDVSLSHR